MKFPVYLLITALLISLGSLSACDSYSPGPDTSQPVESSEDLRVPDSFDWRTQRDITFNLTGYETGLVQLVDEEGTTYHRANLIDTQEYSFRLTIPAYMKEITVRYKGHEKKLRLDQPEISHTFQP
ncbi:hypothetical protein CYPRO_3117 [Cyclonatronum proteinivorum]|uniref:Uncharacterized protein n=1 Tax=Cyclonatronum proteinivorum TaxID=1457365 RepID=A0A345UPF0_9BACT|nr:hypothetical protein [Cyclonatronum proteinivorum]AXJ02352.1 hypothetical protein CYPRO_3117 [Cyclonatronum proteinivorum]